MASLYLVSKFLHSSTVPQLYKSVVVYARDKEDLSDIKTECFSLRSPYLKYTREVAFVANFHRVLRHRYYDVDSDSDDEVDTSKDDNVESDSSEGRDSSHLSQSDNASTSEESHAPNDPPHSPQHNALLYGTLMTHREWTYDPTVAGQTSASDVYLTRHEDFLEALEAKLQPFLDLILKGCLRKFRQGVALYSRNSH